MSTHIATATPAADYLTGKTRIDGWSATARAGFLTALAESGAVSRAVETVGMGMSGLYALRQRDEVFAAAWDAALLLTREHLRDTLIERAFDGEVHITRKDGDETVRRRRNYRLSLGMLDRLEARKFSQLARLFAGHFETVIALIESDAQAPRWRRWLDGIDHELSEFRVLYLFPLAEESAKNAAEFDIWDYDEGVWHTNLPPPDGFDGEEYCDFGDEDYERELSEAEAAIHCERLAAKRGGETPEPSKRERGTHAWADYFGHALDMDLPADGEDAAADGDAPEDGHGAVAMLAPIEVKSMDGLPRAPLIPLRRRGHRHARSLTFAR